MAVMVPAPSPRPRRSSQELDDTCMSVRPASGAAVLVIEDDDAMACQLHDALIGGGYVAQRAASGSEALAAIESARVDLILMSLLLPDTDGLILCSTLRGRTDAPIVMLS